MKRIGKYEICGLLGKGGMSVVYKARLPVVGKFVALKLLAPHPHLLASWGEERIREQFIREACAIASLRHPCVVEVLDFDDAGDRPFFTMEYYYRSLGTILGEASVMDAPCRLLSMEKVIRYACQLLGGLARLHRAGIVHRDIKPHNLLVTEEDQLKICDFGLSRLRGESSGDSTGSVLIGSPFYAAPEQERQPESVDSKADLYSAGVVVCRMLTGLFPGSDGLRRIAERPDAGEAWRAWVERVTHERVDLRPSDARQMLRDLENLAEEWARQRDLFCVDLESAIPREAWDGQAVTLRSEPVKVCPRDAPAVFDCDELLRPRTLVGNAFELLREGKAVLDGSTRLLWELSDWPDPMSWDEGLAYIDGLNREAFAGERSWRLPTVPELLSLSRDPAQPGSACETNPLDPERKRFWTCDRKSFCASWYVDTELGYAGWSDRTGRFFVRGVTCYRGRASGEGGYGLVVPPLIP
ncbi:MAG: protein kinase [Syntrophobacteraceae bacterium]